MREKKKFLGVCVWLAEKFDMDVTIIRLAFIIGAIIGIGSPLLLYVVLYLVMPNR